MKKRFIVGIGIALTLLAVLTWVVYFQVDYKGGAKDILADYENGGTVVGKTAIVKVDEVTVNDYVSGFVSDGQAFIYSGDASQAPKIQEGDKIIIKVTHITPIFNKYVIGYKEDK